jgi:hypothetical protein
MMRTSPAWAALVAMRPAANAASIVNFLVIDSSLFAGD